MLVSVVIPTCRRPRLVVRAAESALSQTYPEIEVVIVPADNDEATRIGLSRIPDDRLRLLPFEGPLNAAPARNRGVQNARGEWIAFLDDDDFWLPDKLRRQLDVAAASRYELPIVSCAMFVRDGHSERVWPRRLPKDDETAGDYLFRRGSLLGASGFFQTTTLLMRRELALAVPFRDIRPCEDMDFVLRAVRHERAGVEFVKNAVGDLPEPLGVWDNDASRPRESFGQSWRNSVDWIRENRDLVSPEAYASFLLTWVSIEAARQRAGFGAFWELWRTASLHGRPSALDLAVHVAHWTVPVPALHRIAAWLTAANRGAGRGPKW